MSRHIAGATADLCRITRDTPFLEDEAIRGFFEVHLPRKSPIFIVT